MLNPVPERLINFRVYNEGNSLAGTASAELPDIESMTDTVTGAGIAGEIDTPTMGQLASMALTLSFRTITADGVSLSAPRAHAIDLRGSQQVYESATGTYHSMPVRVSVRGIPKRVGLGSFEVGSTTDTELELELTYMKIVIDGTERLEVDKYNFKFVVDGVDYLAKVRQDLGM